jgi:hypothetical protein
MFDATRMQAGFTSVQADHDGHVIPKHANNQPSCTSPPPKAIITSLPPKAMITSPPPKAYAM